MRCGGSIESLSTGMADRVWELNSVYCPEHFMALYSLHKHLTMVIALITDACEARVPGSFHVQRTRLGFLRRTGVSVRTVCFQASFCVSLGHRCLSVKCRAGVCVKDIVGVYRLLPCQPTPKLPLLSPSLCLNGAVTTEHSDLYLS